MSFHTLVPFNVNNLEELNTKILVDVLKVEFFIIFLFFCSVYD